MGTAKTRYAQVGLGGRHEMYATAIRKSFADHAVMVGLCDINPGRLQRAQRLFTDDGAAEVPGYTADGFDRMVAETKPDTVIVTSKDSTHDLYICRAMELGCDVITEKPMTIDASRCRRILETRKKTGRQLRVTFNYRYSPPRTQLKDLLMSGVIGNILSLDFHWMLNVGHGADYFRRWHRWKENSGGLMVHKATHHFDLVNWWLSSVPEQVFASGHRRFYRPETAERYGLTKRSERCHDCPESGRCRFYLDMATRGKMKELYLDCEAHDGYYRDRCVFSADMNIEDSMNLVVDYRNGVKMSYSLNAFMPWEGYVVYINGTRGRLEHKCQESVYVSGDGTVPGALKKEGTWTRVYPHWQPAYEEEVWTGEGGHGGGDTLLLADLLSPDPQPDNYRRAADHRAGAWSIMTGVCANHSMAAGRPVRVDELVPDIGLPDYPAMPSPEEPLPVPEN